MIMIFMKIVFFKVSKVFCLPILFFIWFQNLYDITDFKKLELNPKKGEFHDSLEIWIFLVKIQALHMNGHDLSMIWVYDYVNNFTSIIYHRENRD